MAPTSAMSSRRWLLLTDLCMMVALLVLTEAEAMRGKVPKPMLLGAASAYLILTASLLFFTKAPAETADTRSILGRRGPMALSYVPRAVLGLILLGWAFFER